MGSTTFTSETTVVASGGHMSQAINEETVVLSLDAGVYYGLDEVASRIWLLIQEPRTVGSICDAVVAEYDVERERCEQDVIELLDRLADEGLVRAEP